MERVLQPTQLAPQGLLGQTVSVIRTGYPARETAASRASSNRSSGRRHVARTFRDPVSRRPLATRASPHPRHELLQTSYAGVVSTEPRVEPESGRAPRTSLSDSKWRHNHPTPPATPNLTRKRPRPRLPPGIATQDRCHPNPTHVPHLNGGALLSIDFAVYDLFLVQANPIHTRWGPRTPTGPELRLRPSLQNVLSPETPEGCCAVPCSSSRAPRDPLPERPNDRFSRSS